MVGVPCLVMCQVGPISLMDCPAFIRRSTGIRARPANAVTRKAATQLMMILNISFATSKASHSSI